MGVSSWSKTEAHPKILRFVSGEAAKIGGLFSEGYAAVCTGRSGTGF
jgi:hypothetical protein